MGDAAVEPRRVPRHAGRQLPHVRRSEGCELRERARRFRRACPQRLPRPHLLTPHPPSFTNCDFAHDALEADCAPCVAPQEPLYSFRSNARAPRPAVLHFQLRHLVHATTRHDVYFAAEGGVSHYSSVTRTQRKALDSERALAHGLGRVQIATAAASEALGLVAAGGFGGELLVQRIRAPPNAPLLHAARLSGEENAITNFLSFQPHGLGGRGGPPVLVACNNDGVLRVLDVAPGSFVPVSSCRLPWAPNAAAVAPGGSACAVVGDAPAAALVDPRAGGSASGATLSNATPGATPPRTGGVVAWLRGHNDFCFAASWHPGGTLLATGSQDGTARIWDVRCLHASLRCVKGRIGAIRSLSFSPDGSHLAMAEPCDFVHVFDVASGFSVVQEIDLFGEIAGVSFSPDSAGEALYIGVSDQTYGSVLEYARAAPRRTRHLLF